MKIFKNVKNIISISLCLILILSSSSNFSLASPPSEYSNKDNALKPVKSTNSNKSKNTTKKSSNKNHSQKSATKNNAQKPKNITKKSANKKKTSKYITTENELVDALTKEFLSQKSKVVIPLDRTKLGRKKIHNAMDIVQKKPEILSILESWNSESAYIINGKYNLTFNPKYYKGATHFSSTVNKWIKENLSVNMTDEEKVKAIHDYIVLITAYNYGDSNSKVNGYNVYTPLCVLYEGAGVCQGYSLLFYEMAKNAGLKVKYISGDVHKSNNGHAWNMVYVDGRWYHIDVTWDDFYPDKKGEVRYDYYLKSDDSMSKTHIWDRNKFPKSYEDYFKETPNSDFEQSYENIDSSYQNETIIGY